MAQIHIPCATLAGYPLPSGDGFRMCGWRSNESDILAGDWFLDVLIGDIADLVTAEALADNIRTFCKAQRRKRESFEGAGWCD